jgi:hypothetical protein
MRASTEHIDVPLPCIAVCTAECARDGPAFPQDTLQTATNCLFPLLIFRDSDTFRDYLSLLLSPAEGI